MNRKTRSRNTALVLASAFTLATLLLGGAGCGSSSSGSPTGGAAGGNDGAASGVGASAGTGVSGTSASGASGAGTSGVSGMSASGASGAGTSGAGTAGAGAASGSGASGASGAAGAGSSGMSGAAGVAGTASGGAGAGGAGAGGIRWLGRVDASNPAAVKFAWSGTGLVATVQGSKISVRLQTEATSTVFFQPVLDGTPGTRFQVASGAAQTVVLGNNLSAANHQVELYRESEGSYGDSVFLGFADGTVVGAPAATRLIEVVGDSISAGYGNLGNDVHPPYDVSCPFSLDTQSAYASYGWVLARSLGAEASLIARSGWGIYRDLGGSSANVLPSIYGNTLGSQATPAYGFTRKPDAVIINLGTNDSGGTMGDPGKPYEDAYIAFLQTVRSRYPAAWIFLTIGPMTGDPLLTTMRTHLDNVVTRFGDAKVSHVLMAVQDTSVTGCDYHPNVAEDQKMADTLKPALQTKLGW